MSEALSKLMVLSGVDAEDFGVVPVPEGFLALGFTGVLCGFL